MKYTELKKQKPELATVYSNVQPLLDSLRLDTTLDYDRFIHMFNSVSLASNEVYNSFKSIVRLTSKNTAITANLLRVAQSNRNIIAFYNRIEGLHKYDTIILNPYDAFLNGFSFMLGTQHAIAGEFKYNGVISNSTETFAGISILESAIPEIVIEIALPDTLHTYVAIELLFPYGKMNKDAQSVRDQVMCFANTTTSMSVHIYGTKLGDKYFAIIGSVKAYVPAVCEAVWTLHDTVIEDGFFYDNRGLLDVIYTGTAEDSQRYVTATVKPGYCLGPLAIVGGVTSDIQE